VLSGVLISDDMPYLEYFNKASPNLD
jgi:hypothetical protein